MKPRSPSNRNASLEKAHRLLLAFHGDAAELGVMDLARRVGLNKSTVSRFVATLTEVGLLERVEATKKVRLGMRVFELGTLAVEQHPLSRWGGPILDRLAMQVRQTVVLVVPMEDAYLVVQRREAGRAGAAFRPGRRYPLRQSAAGLALLSGQESDANGALAGRENAAALRAELLRTRALGIASAADDPEKGFHTLASPVHDRSGAVVAAICVTGSQAQLAAAGGAATSALRRAAVDLSRRLGFHRGEPVASHEASARPSARTA